MSSAAVVIGALRVNQYQKSFLKNAEFKFAAFFFFFFLQILYDVQCYDILLSDVFWKSKHMMSSY